MTTLKLIRDRLGKVDTTGQLYDAQGNFVCYVLEDLVRAGPKVYAQTAIPAGTYRIQITRSPRFARDLPLLLDVPGFTGIRIHPGNDRDDTEGCLLPGLARQQLPDGSQRVTQSRDAFARLLLLLRRELASGKQVSIQITNGAG